MSKVKSVKFPNDKMITQVLINGKEIKIKWSSHLKIVQGYTDSEIRVIQSFSN